MEYEKDLVCGLERGLEINQKNQSRTHITHESIHIYSLSRILCNCFHFNSTLLTFAVISSSALRYIFAALWLAVRTLSP